MTREALPAEPSTSGARRKPPVATADSHDFRIGNQDCPTGSVQSVDIPVSRLPTGTELSIPLKVVRGLKPGPTVWVSAGIHGDELNGVAVIQKVLERVDPAELRGSVILAPVVNVFGLINRSRYLPDGRDLNRSFPGSQRGSLAARIAHLFMREVVERCELGIDLHTASGGRTNLPQVRCDLDEVKTRKAALQFGAPIVVHSSMPDGSLREASRKRGIPVLVFEGGEAGRFDGEATRIGAEGVLRVMSGLRMLRQPKFKRHAPSLISRTTSWVRARRGGFCSVLVRLGDTVREDDIVAEVFETLGTERTSLKAHKSGVVIGHLCTALVNRGDAVIHLAEVSPESPE